MAALKALWRACEAHAQTHKASFNKAHNWAHLSYLALVTVKGPYHWAALLLVVFMVAGWVLHIEVEEA